MTRQFTHNTPWQFDPNIGASWVPPFGNGNTVIRGGMEVAYDLANYYTTNRVHQNPPYATDTSPNQIAPLCFSESMADWRHRVRLQPGGRYQHQHLSAAGDSPIDS